MKREIGIIGMIVFLGIGFGLGWVIPGFLPTAEGPTLLDEIQANDLLRVGTDTNWPPFEMYNATTDEFYGFEIELCELIADELNVTLQMVEMDFGALPAAVKAGTIDMIAAAMFITPERIKELAHSVPYIRTNMVCIAKANETFTISGYADLEGHQVGVQAGTAEEFELEDFNLAGGSISYTTYPKADLLLQVLLSDAVDVAFVDEPVFTEWTKTEDLKILYTVLAEPTALWMRQGEPELVEAVDEIILTAYTDGTLDAMIATWFS